jgi:hypothetical protein
MYEIRPWLLVGAHRDATDELLLTRWQVGAMLLLAAPVNSLGRECCYLVVEDGEPLAAELLQQGVAFVADARRRGLTCLMACGAGISRSVIFATAALCVIEGMDLLAAAAAVKRQHPEAVFHPALWESLNAFLGADVSILQLLREVGP